MDDTLRPSTLSEILDRTAQLYRARFMVFFGIAFIPTATLLVFAGAVTLLAVHSRSSSGGGILSILGVIGLVLIGMPALVGATALATAALSHAAARSVFSQPITIRDSYRAVWRRGWRYAGLLAVQFAAVWIVPFAAWSFLIMIAAGLAALAGDSSGGVIGFASVVVLLGLICYGFWMSVRLSLGFPACVVEQTGTWAALRRSWSLGSATRGRIFVLYLLCVALNWILSFAIWMPFFILVQIIPGADSFRHQQAFATISMLVLYGAGFAVQAFTRPVYAIALILFYYDQRMRKEGFDIEWMMLQAGLIVPGPGDPQSQAAHEPAAQPWADVVAAMATDMTQQSPPIAPPSQTGRDEPGISMPGVPIPSAAISAAAMPSAAGVVAPDSADAETSLPAPFDGASPRSEHGEEEPVSQEDAVQDAAGPEAAGPEAAVQELGAHDTLQHVPGDRL